MQLASVGRLINLSESIHNIEMLLYADWNVFPELHMPKQIHTSKYEGLLSLRKRLMIAVLTLSKMLWVILTII
jgi:hypothetical protein